MTSVVVVYAIASMAYVASSEQRATRHRHRGRAHHRPSLALPAIPRTLPRPNVTLPDWLQAPPEEAFEFIRTDVGIGRLPVKLVGGVPGFLSEANGPTHQAIEIELSNRLPVLRAVGADGHGVALSTGRARAAPRGSIIGRFRAGVVPEAGIVNVTGNCMFVPNTCAGVMNCVPEK